MFPVNSDLRARNNFPTHRNLRTMMEQKETQYRNFPKNSGQQFPVHSSTHQVVDPRLYWRPLRLPNLPTLNERHRVDVRRELVPRLPQQPISEPKPRGLMGILMQDETKVRQCNQDEMGGCRQRKRGQVVRHPLDMIDTNSCEREHEKRNNMTARSASAMERHTTDGGVGGGGGREKENKRSFSFLPLKRAGSITSSIVSRKSSSRSIGSNRSKGTNRSFLTNRSNVTITSTGSYIKKNSGNFDGGNSRSRRKSSSALQRKESSSSRREQMISDFYRDLEELEELSSSDSEDEDGKKEKGPKKLKKGQINVEEIASQQRVEEYLMNLEQPDPSDVTIDEDEGIISDTTNKSDMSDEKFDSSFNSNYSTDISMNSTGGGGGGGVNNSRKYIKRPTPPENIIKNLDSSPIRQRHRFREERTSSDNSRGLVDINKNKLNRGLPKPPKEIMVIDKSLRDSFIKDGVDCHVVPTKKDLFIDDTASESSCSTDSAHGSTRSISTASSASVFQQNQKPIHRHHHQRQNAGVPKNFIPGHTKPVVNPRKSDTNVKPRKVSFCLRGIPFRVYNNTPRTFRALAHAGCIGLVVPAPESHKCKH